MRILDVNNFYSPTGGGVRTYHHRKLEYCSRDRDITAALVVPDTFYRKDPTDRGVIYRVPSPPLGATGYRMIVRGNHLERVVDDFQPEIIEIGSGYFLPGLVRRIAAERQIPRVGFYHADYPDTLVALTLGRIPLLGKGIVAGCWGRVGRTYGDMAAVFGASRTVLRKLSRAGLRRLFRVPLGVDGTVFSPSMRSGEVRTITGAVEGKKLLLYLARLNPEKGIDLLMESYPMFRKPEGIVLLIVGKGTLEKRVRRFADRFPEVMLLPFTSDEKRVAELMASCDVYLSLGSHETFCLATLEAMSAGTVVVAPDSGGAGELAEDAGILDPYISGDPSSLAASVEKALELSDTDIAAECRTFASGYSWESTFDILFDCYRQVISAYGDGDPGRLESPDGWREP